MSEGPSDASSQTTPATDLYRREAVAAATSRMGSPVRPMGLSGLVVLGFMVALFISVAVFLVIGRYARKETVPGVIQPSAGAARVTTLSAGVISEVFVTDGQPISQGTPILRFTSDPSVSPEGGPLTALSGLIAEGTAREAEALVSQGRAQIEGHARSLDDIRARREGLRADGLQLTESLALQRDRVRLAQETLEAGRALSERELFSLLQLRQREEAFIAARQGLGTLQREIRQNEALSAQLDAEEGRLRAQLAQTTAEMRGNQARLDQRRAEQLAAQGVVLVAGRSGRIVALQARPGAVVQPGQALATILPEGVALQAELWAPSRAAGFLQVGAPVRLMYDAFPYQKFGVGRGRVVAIAGAPTNPADLPVPIETKEALYRVVVAIEAESVNGYGRKWRLTPGMRLSADLVLDERSLWEWLFDPIIAAQRRSDS